MWMSLEEGALQEWAGIVKAFERHSWWLYVGSHYACAARRRSWWEKAVAWLKGVL